MTLRAILLGFAGAIVFFLIGIALVAGCSLARWRLPWWPLHPVMFLIWTSWTSARTFAASLLVGCLVKVLVVKYGGDPVYQKLKPLMIGLIAGDMLGGLVPIVVGYLYYLVTGVPPQSFQVLPG